MDVIFDLEGMDAFEYVEDSAAVLSDHFEVYYKPNMKKISTYYLPVGLRDTLPKDVDKVVSFEIKVKEDAQAQTVDFPMHVIWCDLEEKYPTYIDTTVPITIKEIPAPELKITKLPTQTVFTKGDEFNCNGGEIQYVTYEGTTTLEMTNPAVTVSGYDMNRVGEQDVIISYKDITATYQITVNESPITSINIKNEPSPAINGNKVNNFVQDQVFDVMKDGLLSVEHENGDVDEVEITKDMLTGYNMATVGEQDVTVSYGGFQTTNVGDQVLTIKFHEKTDNFTVTVKSWDAVNELVDAIDKIPEKLNGDDRAMIDGLASKYDSLSEREKSEVKNYDKLQKALDEFNKPFHDEVSIDDIQFVADGPAAALPYETKLDVLKAIAKANLEGYDIIGEAYNIGYHYLNKDGEGVNAEPKAPITLAVALNDLTEGRNYKVGIELKDGSIKFVDATYQKGYLIFETDQVGTLSFWQSKAPASGGQTDVTTQTPSSVLNPGTGINGGGQVALLSIIALLGVTFCVVLLRYRGKNRN